MESIMLAILALIGGVAIAAAPTYVFTLSSDPSGAAVIDSMGNEVCRTPCDLQFAQFAFRAPRLITDRYAGTEVGYVVAKAGYNAETIFITKGPFAFVNLNGTHLFNYFVIPSREAFVRLAPERRAEMSPSPTTQAPCAAGFGRAADGNCYPITGAPAPPTAALPAGPAPSPGWLGLAVVDTPNRGIVVHVVLHQSPADWAGMEVGMRVLYLNGEAVTSSKHMKALLEGLPAGAEVKIIVENDQGQRLVFAPKLEAKPPM